MKEDKKEGWYVTEESHDLFKAAQKDIITVNCLIKDTNFGFEEKVDSMCRNVTEAVEKMIKGWLRDYDPQLKVPKTHDLCKLYDILYEIDEAFVKIKNQINSLNNYTTEFRYSSKFKIEDHEFRECLKNVKFVYDFELIKNTRDKMNEKNKFNVLPDDISALFGEFS